MGCNHPTEVCHWDDYWDVYEDEPWDVTDMLGIGSEPPLAQPDLAEPDLVQLDPVEPDLGERSLDCMRCRSEDAQRQARQAADPKPRALSSAKVKLAALKS